jgi:PKD repeat protein
MDEMSIGRKIFLALSIVMILGILIVPCIAATVMDKADLTGMVCSIKYTRSISSNSACANICLGDSSCTAAAFIKAGASAGPNAVCQITYDFPECFIADYSSTWYLKRDTISHPNPYFPSPLPSCPIPIVADFSAPTTKGLAPLNVEFLDSSSTTISGHTYDYGSRRWDFDNDGNIDSYEENPTYIYTKPGTYTVKLTYGGLGCLGGMSGAFQTETKTGYITVIARYGSIKISSTPSGVKVSVDSVYKGVTPLTVTNVNPGSHSIELNLNNYTSQTKSVTVTADKTSEVSVTLIPTEGTLCDDGNKCTDGDIIKEGKCTGTPKVCDDNKSETDDTCNTATGACVYTIKPDGTICDDNNPCTVNDVMKGGACTSGTPLTCDDKNPTTADTCDPKSGCVYTALKPMLISVISPSTMVSTGEPANLVITVIGAGNTPVADATVELSTPQGGALVNDRGSTNSSGTFTSKFSAPEAGTYAINATVMKEGYLTGSQTLTITVTPGWPLMTLLPLILVIAVIAIIMLFLLTRNRLQLIVKQTSIPADGRSTIPVKVQFASGLGSLKNQSVDRDVSLTATSGTIKPMLISRGKAFAETVLTASREVGRVKVTAQYGNQQAEAVVNFTIEGGMIEISAEPKQLPADGMSAAMITLRLKDKSNIPISFMDERTMQISTTLGTIPGSITIPPHATEVKTSFAPGTMAGIAAITAIVDQLKGEATMKIGALAERYCQRCGTKVSMEAIICSNCKQSPTIPDRDTQQCPFCKEELPRSATYCNKCGRNQAQQPATPPQRQNTQRGAEVTTGKKFCGDCGAEFTPGMKFCNNCGAKIN